MSKCIVSLVLLNVDFRVTFGVHPDTHIDEMQKSEQVMLDGSWSAKIAITGMYLLLLMSTFSYCHCFSVSNQ